MQSLMEKDVGAEPILQVTKWWDDSMKSEITEINAMTLATASLIGVPAARIVLLKDYSTEGFVLFRNYEHYK